MCWYVVYKHETLVFLLLITRKSLPIGIGYRLVHPIQYLTSSQSWTLRRPGTVDTGRTLTLLATGTSFNWMWILYSTVNNLKHLSFCRRVTIFLRVRSPSPATQLLQITPAQYANFKSLLIVRLVDRTFDSSPQRTRKSDPVRSTSSSAARGNIYLVVDG